LKVFWDTSAAINALVSAQVFHRLDSDEHFARVHLLSEFFSVMTGRGIQVLDQNGQPARMLLKSKDAATWLRTFAGKVTFVDLTAAEILDAMDRGDTLRIEGKRIYDYGHALGADKAGAELLLTRDTQDFAGLGKARIERP
jgi:hypothetical protein